MNRSLFHLSSAAGASKCLKAVVDRVATSNSLVTVDSEDSVVPGVDTRSHAPIDGHDRPPSCSTCSIDTGMSV